MSVTQDWLVPFLDRLPNSPAADWIQSPTAVLELDGLPHSLGRHVAECCGLVGRTVKRGSHLALFLPPPDCIDVAGMAVYLYLVRLAVLSGLSAPGCWGNQQNLSVRKDILVFGNASRLRAALLERLSMDGEPLTRKLRISWPARRGSESPIESVGERRLPELRLIPHSELALGLRPEHFDRGFAPFAILADSTEGDPKDLATALWRLRETFAGVPIVLIGQIGDKRTILSARKAAMPVWILRAGDIARLRLAPLAGASSPSRPVGLDRAAAVLVQGLLIDIEVIDDPHFAAAVATLVDALAKLERAVAEGDELLYQPRRWVRDLLALAVSPVQYEEAIASIGRVGPYATSGFRARLSVLSTLRPQTGDATEALENLIAAATKVLDTLSSRSSVLPKQAALTTVVAAAKKARRVLWVVCRNEAMQRALHALLGSHGAETVDSEVYVLTRAQLLRALATGVPSPPEELLLLEPPGFEAGIYFSGVAPRVHLIVYDVERHAMQEQLRFIAHDTQCESEPAGDKYDLAVLAWRPTSDVRVSPAPPLWKVQERMSDARGLLPGPIPSVRPFLLAESGWLQRALDEDEGEDPDKEESAPFRATDDQGPRILIELDDGEAPVVLPPTTLVVVLDELARSGEGSVSAADLRVGMSVVVVRERPDVDLFGLLHERLELSAEYQVAIQFVRMWDEALGVLRHRSQGSAALAFSLLLPHGLTVTTAQAVHHWLRGAVIGPRDADCVRAVGRVTDRAELIRHYRKVHLAMAEVRRSRRTLGRKLTEYVRNGAALGPEALIDPRLGLHRSDLEEMTRIGRIVRLKQVG